MELSSWIEKLESSGSRGRGAVLAELCRISGWSRDTAYRRLKNAGWVSGRKIRSDCGRSSVSEENIDKAAALLSSSQRKDGRNPMSVRRAWGVLQDNRCELPVGDAQLSRLLRDRGLDKASLKRGEAHVDLRSLHPNHCHMVDPSLALWYFTPQGLRVVHAEENYKNKDFYQGNKIEEKCWRYVLVDHYSGSICVRYYQSAGENIYNLYDFLLYAWGRKAEALYAFCGVPELLVWDKGSANQSRAIKRALASLGVEHWAHKAGAPRAKGSVETMNRHFEGWLETALRFEPVPDIQRLNELASKYCAAFNANAFEYHDSQLKRRQQVVGVRLELWQQMEAGQLRLLPDDKLCRSLLTDEPVQKKVGNNLMLSFRGYVVKTQRYYTLAGLPGIEAGKEVSVQPLLYSGNDTVRVSWFLPRHRGGEQMVYELEPIAINAAGFPETAAVIGEEFKALPHTDGQKRRKAVQEPEVLEGLKTHSMVQYKAELPEIKDLGGQPIELQTGNLSFAGDFVLPLRPEAVSSADVRYSVSEAVARIRSELGSLPEGLSARLRASYPNGLNAEEIQEHIYPYQEKRQEAI